MIDLRKSGNQQIEVLIDNTSFFKVQRTDDDGAVIMHGGPHNYVKLFRNVKIQENYWGNIHEKLPYSYRFDDCNELYHVFLDFKKYCVDLYKSRFWHIPDENNKKIVDVALSFVLRYSEQEWAKFTKKPDTAIKLILCSDIEEELEKVKKENEFLKNKIKEFMNGINF
jgi:hypothetical protein